MLITIDHLLLGLKAKMTPYSLAEHLGSTVEAVRARIRTLTPEEEAFINKEMDGY